jgi:ubiquitin-conjugating enzyme E2 C
MSLDGGVAKRLQSELMSMMMEPVEGVSAFPGDDITVWAATVEGVNKDGVYHGLSYSLSMTFPPNYPMSPPTVKFTTPIWHPNVDQSGNICLDILKDKWSATYTVSTLLLSIQGLLDTPNNDSPLNSQAAQLWDRREEYEQVVRKKYQAAIAQQRLTASC